MKKLDVFIGGESMDLCIPTREFARESEWYSWFNIPKINKFLEQGAFPNTQDDQEEFYLSQKPSRLMLIVSNKCVYLGIISLSEINLIKKTCAVAIIINSAKDVKSSPIISLEAMARITEHAFQVVGVNRIVAGQHVKLNSWQQRMELLGYKVEGIHKGGFVKGRESADSVSIACTYEDYAEILSCRGALWDSKEKMKTRFKQLPKQSFKEKMSDFFDRERASYYKSILNL